MKIYNSHSYEEIHLFKTSTSLVAETNYSPQAKNQNPKRTLRTPHSSKKSRYIHVTICNVGNLILAGSDSREKNLLSVQRWG